MGCAPTPPSPITRWYRAKGPFPTPFLDPPTRCGAHPKLDAGQRQWQMPTVMPTHAVCVLQCALRMARDATDLARPSIHECVGCAHITSLWTATQWTGDCFDCAARFSLCWAALSSVLRDSAIALDWGTSYKWVRCTGYCVLHTLCAGVP